MVTEPQALKAKALVPDLWFLLQMFPSADSEGTGLDQGVGQVGLK